MTDRVKNMLAILKKRDYRKLRSFGVRNVTEETRGLNSYDRRAKLLELAFAAEVPSLYGGDDIFGFNRTTTAVPRDDEVTDWGFGNVILDFEKLLSTGLDGIKAEAEAELTDATGEERDFLCGVIKSLAACDGIIERYRVRAEIDGRKGLAAALGQVPKRGARSYYEALLTVKFMVYALRLNRNVHTPLGRFDQYMKPYYELSKNVGATDEEIKELTELFFISLNFDTDIYLGVQTGDNGQSMVLGGMTPDGEDGANALTEICLAASEELKLIDPKINLRVNERTPISVYERGTRLTKQGLGFPQYMNDDVVIPALMAWGYDERDARNYAVAACWEFIMSGNAADIPNAASLNFPLSVERATKKLGECRDFDEFTELVKREVKAQVDELTRQHLEHLDNPDLDPFVSAFVGDCIRNKKDVRRGGAKYNNYGMHGAGLSNAADAVTAIKVKVFDEKSVTPDELNAAIEANFEGFSELRNALIACPKTGNNDALPDGIMRELAYTFADALKGKTTPFGGVWRAGTGSAMEYVNAAAVVGATADGRKAGEYYACSFSPSLTARLSGPLSAVQSFTSFDLAPVCNGGPFTIEIHDAVFRNAEGEKKTAALVKAFIDRGGHQIQINAINRDKLLDAQAHPENYPNLIVRVWGWSGYFAELDKKYQDHVIKRAEFNFG